MAYSTKIHNPAFEQYRQKSKNYGFLFGLGLVLAAIIGFYLYGESGGDIIFSNARGSLHEMEEEVCRNRGCPLLK
ncbi:MAG TPA: hypothetical protein PKM75_11555 [Prolixibacteraceae bacterium]|nr:hypothetical protein [Prolixibacteraceae bacterium]